MTASQTTMDKLYGMRMSVMAQAYRDQEESQGVAEMTFDERFAMIVDAEWDARRINRRTRLLRQAGFSDPEANIADVRYDADRKLDRTKLIELSNCTWIRGHRNVVITGASGAGKSWIACALGVAACNAFFSVRYVRLPEMLDELNVSKNEDWLKAKKRYTKCDLRDTGRLAFGKARGEGGARAFRDSRGALAQRVLIDLLRSSRQQAGIQSSGKSNRRCRHRPHSLSVRTSSILKATSQCASASAKSITGRIGPRGALARPLQSEQPALLRGSLPWNAVAVERGNGVAKNGAISTERRDQPSGVYRALLCSMQRPVVASLAIPGIVRLSGSMDDLKGLEDILRVAKNAGAKRILLPFSAIRDMQDIPMELASSVSPDFYQDGDIVGAARKALGI